VYTNPSARQVCGRRGQGQSVLHNAQELEEFAGAIAEITERDGNFLAAGQTQQMDGRVAEDR
jgi:hypothetical protein